MYYIILNPLLADPSLLKDIDNNLHAFDDISQAITYADLAKQTGTCQTYIIVTECTKTLI